MTDTRTWGVALFCDDIRAEIGGKLSLMGIYLADILFPASLPFPITLTKFCILIKYFESMPALTDDITIRVFLPGDLKDAPSVTLPFPRASMVQGAIPTYPLDEDQDRIFNLTFPLALTPLIIKQEGFIKVRALCGTRATKLGSLMVRKARPNENIEFPFAPQTSPTVSG